MEEEDLIDLTPNNYHEWSPLMAKYLSEHNALPYAPDLEYTIDQIEILIPTLFFHMKYKV